MPHRTSQIAPSTPIRTSVNTPATIFTWALASSMNAAACSRHPQCNRCSARIRGQNTPDDPQRISLVYALNKQLLGGDVGVLTGFYFSFITQLTIGYGDVYPVGWLRYVAVIQGLTAALFVLLVFGKIVASLRPLKDNTP
jgi:ion channel